MGKKAKVGKARKDRFYHLAKETGYRSRAAFKLIQLNRKFEFLQKSNVIIDLCAAPGGWLQVVAENAPMSNHIIGIDLVPITAIKGVTTLEEDITTEKCRQALKKQLHTAKADLVLNDGAPNVGTNWLNDAFQQVELTLHALKLATEFLRKGGWFVTKIFRSKDYDSLMWVFQQLFKNVHATKPQASRNESAEIFVVCQHFLAPDKIDPKFLNPKYVFKEVSEEKKLAIDLVHPAKRQRHREGYPEGDYTLFTSLPVTKFISSSDYMTLLAQASEIKFDSDEIENHPLTTTEIRECLKDIKLLGKSEIKNVFKWRTKLKKALEESNTIPKVKEPADVEMENNEQEEEEDELAADEKEMAELDKMIEERNMQELREMKKAKKKVKKAQMKQKARIDSKMVIPGDRLDVDGDSNVFDMKRIRNKEQLSEIEAGDLSVLDGEDMFEEDSDEDALLQPKRKSFEKGEKKYIGPGDDEDEEEEMEEEPDFEDVEDDDDDQQVEDDDKEVTNPLLVDMGVKARVMKDKEDMWFSKSVFEDLDREADEDIELVQMGMEGETKKKREKKDKAKEPDLKGDLAKIDSDDDLSSDEDSYYDDDSGVESKDQDDVDEDDSDDDSGDSDYDYMEANSVKKQKTADGEKKVTKIDGIEIVPVTPDPKLQLNEEGLAIGAAMVKSRKRRREIVDSGYHRYMYDDTGLPDWFDKDEKKHTQRRMPISKAEMEEYKMKSKAIDAAPIKKIAEAKARKKKRMLKSLEKARKKANAISDNVDVSEKEKWNQIKHVYKKAGLLKKANEKVTYVMAKKGAGKKVHRPTGVKGKFKVVDGRMKKDTKGQQKADNRKMKNSTKRRKQHKAKANKRVRR